MTAVADMSQAGPVAFVVRGAPYGRRSARAELDVVLLAAAVGRPLRLYFIGNALWQVVAGRDPAAAELPAGYRAWAGVSELTDVSAFAEPRRLAWLAGHGYETLLPVVAMEHDRMREDWRGCERVLVL